MEDLKIVKEQPTRNNVLMYILCALFPALGFMFYITRNYNEDKQKKNSLLISIISAGVFICLLLASVIVSLTHSTFHIGAVSCRGVLLILATYLMINTISYLIFTYVYFDKDRSEPFGTKKYVSLKHMFVSLLVALFILILYNLDEIVVSFPRGIPWETFSWAGGQDYWITFYALFIFSGAIVSYVISINNCRNAGYEKHMFDSILYVAFPAGIIGARIWYCIAEWEKSFAMNPLEVFDIRGGGLAIQGGVLAGAFFGMWIMCEFHREMKLRDAMDMIIPSILIAQAIGRWGNFINNEVYGRVVNPDQWWFIPRFIVTHMQAYCGDFYVPLFLIEGLANILGYFVITRVLGKLLKKYMVPGNQGFAYLIWYGTVRSIMEPFRNPEFIMGDASSKVSTSVIMSYCFIGAGIILIGLNYLYEYIVNTEKYVAYKDAKYERFHHLAEKFENMPKWARLLLALPIIDAFAYSYYRFIKGHYFSALLWLIFGGPILWIVDIFCVLTDHDYLCSEAYV